MSGIAWVLLKRGITVSGSDLVSNRMTQRLAGHGAQCFIGHKPEQLDRADLVIVSTAIDEDNCELREARRRGVLIWHRAQALGALMAEGHSIAVTGSHGKTTTTSMVGLLFERAGRDPTVIVGGESLDFGGTAKAGRRDLVITELDESDGSFLGITPDQVLINNIEPDHLDHYADYEALVAAFEQFMSAVRQPPVVCSDDPGVRQAIAGGRRPVVRYSIADREADFSATRIRLTSREVCFDVMQAGKCLGKVRLPAPGLHNVGNALGAVAVALQAGLEPAVCCDALSDYRGVERRLTVRSESGGVLIADDYAHHPTEIRAALEVGRGWANERGGRLVCVFQPHRYTRTATLGRQFGPAFADADQVVVTGIYSAGEKPIEGITGALIAESVRESGHPHLHYVAKTDAVADLLVSELEPADVVMTLGAGDVWQVADRLRDRLETEKVALAPETELQHPATAEG